MSEENRFSQRIKRYASVTAAMSGLAARLAGERYLGISIDRDAHADDLRKVLGQLKGPLMKVAQILATVPDMLPPEYALELAELQSNAPSMGGFFVKRRMSAELGPDWQKYFQEFNETAAAAASLGQVHRAVLASTAETVACKLQYPDMASVVEADLDQLKVVLSVYESFNAAIQTHNMYQEIKDRLHEELDYGQEAKHIALYQHMLSPFDFIHLPKVYPLLSTDRLLTMSWMEGEKMLTRKHASQEMRDTIARNMFTAWYVPFYHFGIIHGDPHLGNYSVLPSGDINLLDFGCIRVFKPSFVKSVIDLYRALQTNDMELAHHAYTTWGFDTVTKELMETLNLWAKFLYGPLMDNRVRPIQEGNSGVYGKQVADTVHQQLQDIGGVSPPREFVFMDRAAVGIGSVFMHLDARLNWHTLFEELIEGFEEETLRHRQSKALVSAGLNSDC